MVEGVDYSIEPAEAGWKWFVNNYHGYRFKFPEDWNIDLDLYDEEIGEETESPDYVSIDEPEHGESSGFFGVEVITREKMKEYLKQVNMKVDMNRYDRQLFAKSEIEDDVAHKCHQDFELLEYKNISLDGVPSTLTICTYTYIPSSTHDHPEDKDKDMILLIYPEEIRGKIYLVSYIASRPLDRADRLTENLPTAMKMIGSFEFI